MLWLIKYKNIVGTGFAPYVKKESIRSKRVNIKNLRTLKRFYITNRNASFRLKLGSRNKLGLLQPPKQK